MYKWIVAEPAANSKIVLGFVHAWNKRTAITQACQEWPKYMDWSKPNGGFQVVRQSVFLRRLSR